MTEQSQTAMQQLYQQVIDQAEKDAEIRKTMEGKTREELEELVDEKRDELRQIKREKKAAEDLLSERETEGSVTPDTFEKVARAIHNDKRFAGGHRSDDHEKGVRENGFVHKSVGGRGALVGMEQGAGTYIIAEIQSGSETINRNDPRLKTSQNEYTKAELKECSYNGPLNDVDAIQEAFKAGERIDTGYIHGHRVTKLSKVLNETFRYYSESET